MNIETVSAALSLIERREDFAWATIVSTRGSSPRHVDTSMLVRADGSIAGTIGGGPLEAAVIKSALDVLQSKHTRLMDFDSRQLGMLCGGGGSVLIERVDSARTEVLDLYRGLLDLLRSGRKGWIAAVVRDGDDGAATVSKALVDSEGSVYGDHIGSPEALQELTKKGGTYDLIAADDPAAHTYIQPIASQGTAYVFGAGHCGEKLAPVLSSVGFATVVVDDRDDFANRERFPTAGRIVVPELFEGVVGTLPIDNDSYVVIVTRGHMYDRSVLRQALATRAGYIGMMGSRKKVAETLQVLREEGFSPENIARVHAPIGLPIGGETPEEIAISIAAEMIQVRAERRQ
jgi:xanthine dehydrogenase accessory factor